MHQIVQILFFHFFIAPLDRTSFPTGYEYYQGTELEYRVQYKWEGESLISHTRQSETGEIKAKTFLVLDNNFHVIADSALGADGRTYQVGRYEFQGGKPATYRTSSQVTSFFYAGNKLDSIAVKRGDSLIEYYTYRYDSQDHLVQSDHFYDKGGSGRLEDYRSLVEYFLPDSIVVNLSFVPANGDSARRVIYLANDLPVKMIEREYHSSSSSVNTHIWTFAIQNSIAKGRKKSHAKFEFGKNYPEHFDLLGRLVSAGSQARQRL